MFQKKLLFLLGIMIVLSVMGIGICRYASGKSQMEEEPEFRVVTSFYPMYILTKNLTQGAVSVSVDNLTGNQTGCLHDYQLTAKDMKLLSVAELFVMNGAGMELFAEQVAKNFGTLVMLDASQGISLLAGEAHEHAHGNTEGTGERDRTDTGGQGSEPQNMSGQGSKPQNTGGQGSKPQNTGGQGSKPQNMSGQGGEPQNTGGQGSKPQNTNEQDSKPQGTDGQEEKEPGAEHDKKEQEHWTEGNGHVWMDVERYRLQADNVYKALRTADTVNAEYYRQAYESYDKKLSELSAEVKELSVWTGGMPVVLFHEAFAYLADSLGMESLALLALDEEEVPSAGEIADAVKEIRYHGFALIFIEEQYVSHAEKIAAETNALIVCLNPLTTGEDDADSYLKGMRENLEAVRKALGERAES